MKSLVKGAKSPVREPERERRRLPAKETRREVAQCCAKVSKTVAGCHD